MATKSTSKHKVRRVKFDSPEGIALRQRVLDEVERERAYIRKHGAKSSEGYYETPLGPKSIEG